MFPMMFDLDSRAVGLRILITVRSFPRRRMGTAAPSSMDGRSRRDARHPRAETTQESLLVLRSRVRSRGCAVRPAAVGLDRSIGWRSSAPSPRADGRLPLPHACAHAAAARAAAAAAALFGRPRPRPRAAPARARARADARARGADLRRGAQVLLHDGRAARRGLRRRRGARPAARALEGLRHARRDARPPRRPHRARLRRAHARLLPRARRGVRITGKKIGIGSDVWSQSAGGVGVGVSGRAPSRRVRVGFQRSEVASSKRHNQNASRPSSRVPFRVCKSVDRATCDASSGREGRGPRGWFGFGFVGSSRSRLHVAPS